MIRLVRTRSQERGHCIPPRDWYRSVGHATAYQDEAASHDDGGHRQDDGGHAGTGQREPTAACGSGGSGGSTGSNSGTGSGNAGSTSGTRAGNAGSTSGRNGGTGTGLAASEPRRDTSFADGVTIDMPQDPAATRWQSRVVLATDGGSPEAHDYVEGADGSFGFDLGKTRGNYGVYDEIPGSTAEAIPVLFTDGKSRDLDGIYSVNYGPGKLAIKPSSKKVEIPDPKEIRNSAEQALSFLYQTQSGVFEVTFGNGIVTLYPKDAAALAIVVSKDKKAERAVLASGLLTAIEDLGVTPIEIRAVYIFKEMKEEDEE